MISRLLSDTGVPSGIDVKELSEFLIEDDPNAKKQFPAKLAEATPKLQLVQRQREHELASLCKKKKPKTIPTDFYHSKDKWRRLCVLRDALIDAWNEYVPVRQPEVQKEVVQLVQMLALLDYIKEKDLQLLPDVEKMKGREGGDSDERRRYECIKTAFRREMEEYNEELDEFADDSHGLEFFRNYVDLAMSRREIGSGYFELLEKDESIFTFLECPHSPLTKAHLIPISVEPNFESVTAWIESAVSILAKWEGTKSYERRTVISMLVTRLLFSHLHEKLMCKQTVAKREETMLKDEEIEKWLDQSQFYVCPLDAAHSIYIAHKVMTDREYTKTNPFGHEGDITVEKMAHLIGGSDIPDPKAFSEWLIYWSRLNIFSSESIAALHFLEREAKALYDHNN